MRYNGVITLPNLNPEKYLTKDILSKISLAVKGKEKDLDKQAYLLKDGTLIMIEKPIAGMTGDGLSTILKIFVSVTNARLPSYIR